MKNLKESEKLFLGFVIAFFIANLAGLAPNSFFMGDKDVDKLFCHLMFTLPIFFLSFSFLIMFYIRKQSESLFYALQDNLEAEEEETEIESQNEKK